MEAISEFPGSTRALSCIRPRLAVGSTRATAPEAVDDGVNRRMPGRVRSPPLRAHRRLQES